MKINNTFLLAGLLTIGVPITWADTLSDNLGALTNYTEVASGSSWVTASFGTGASSYSLADVILLLSNPASGNAQVDLYSTVGGHPGSLLTTLNSPSSYSSTLSNTTFNSTGYLLSPNATYWVVLKGLSGSFEWAYTDSSAGSGVGFQHTWGISDDAGASWFTSDIQPMQMSVQASAVPEPSTASIVLAALGLLAFAARRSSAFSKTQFEEGTK